MLNFEYSDGFFVVQVKILQMLNMFVVWNNNLRYILKDNFKDMNYISCVVNYIFIFFILFEKL
jgi:hypothetical protein